MRDVCDNRGLVLECLPSRSILYHDITQLSCPSHPDAYLVSYTFMHVVIPIFPFLICLASFFSLIMKVRTNSILSIIIHSLPLPLYFPLSIIM